MKDTNVRRVAEKLLNAREINAPLDAAGLGFAPQNLDEAYAVQSLVAAALGPTGAWKVGAPSPDGDSHYAPLATTGVHDSPAYLPAAAHRLRGIEVEIAYRLAADLPARDEPYAAAEVADAIDAALPTIEVVESRLVDRTMAGGLWALADNQSHGALILGPICGRWQEIDILEAHVRIDFGTRNVIDRVCHNAAGDPFGQVVRLANLAAGHCGGLRAGQIITTGSLMGVEFAPAGSRVRATVSGLGAIEVEFE